MVNIMKNKIKYLPIGILTLTTAVSGVALSSARVAADTQGSRDVSVTVGTSCNFSESSSYSGSLSVYPGNTSNTEADSSKSFSQVTCNNPNGFSIQAQGFSPDSEHPDGYAGNTWLYDSLNGGTIPTGNSGEGSYWSFRVSQAFSTTQTTVTPGYNVYTLVPENPVTIVSFNSTTSSTVIGAVRTDYQVHVGSVQTAGAYKGSVKYTIVNGTGA